MMMNKQLNKTMMLWKKLRMVHKHNQPKKEKEKKRRRRKKKRINLNPCQPHTWNQGRMNRSETDVTGGKGGYGHHSAATKGCTQGSPIRWEFQLPVGYGYERSTVVYTIFQYKSDIGGLFAFMYVPTAMPSMKAFFESLPVGRGSYKYNIPVHTIFQYSHDLPQLFQFMSTPSPLEIPGVDMVEDYTIDPMHTVYLGAGRRGLYFMQGAPSTWVNRDVTNPAFKAMGEMFGQLRFTCEFSREARNFDHLEKWKATELRMFYLYGADVILRFSQLPEVLVYAIQQFCMAIRILADPELYLSMSKHALQFIQCYLDTMETHYGVHFVTLIMHCLLHLPDECVRHGPLDSFSCFKYENTLKTLKSRLRSYRYPLESLTNQLQYQSNFVSKKTRNVLQAEPLTLLSQPFKNLDLDYNFIGGTHYKSIFYKNFKLSVHKPDCYFVCKDDRATIHELKAVIKTGEDANEIALLTIEWSTVCAYHVPTNVDYRRNESTIVGVRRMTEQASGTGYVTMGRVHRKCVVHTISNQMFSYELLDL